MPVCVGERLVTRSDFRPILDKQIATFILPDIVRCGGIPKIRKIVTMAEAYYIPCSPDDATGPITMATCAEVMMSTPNFYRLEIAYPEVPYYTNPTTRRQKRLLKRPRHPRPGPRTKPGLRGGGADKSLIH